MEKELRLGNLVFGIGNKVMKVAKIETPQFSNWNGADDFHIVLEHLEKKDYYMECGVNPIPLTEEWLLKLGFEKDKDDNFSLNFNKEIFTLFPPLSVRREQKNYIFKISWGGLSRYRELKYVHELQNIFFALTSSELNIINK